MSRRHILFVAGEIGWLLLRSAVYLGEVTLLAAALALILFGADVVEIALFGAGGVK